MHKKIKYLIGVDGGGSGTRVVVCDIHGAIILKADGEPSALSLGVDRAWRSIVDTLAFAFTKDQIAIPSLNECAIGLGLSGANNIIWKNEFLFHNPGFKIIEVDTDGYTTLLGAHEGNPGSIVALGTGSIGMILNKNGERNYVSGWGFPSGDEASGSWLGVQAIKLAQKNLDKRISSTPFIRAIMENSGRNPDELLKWLASANQNTFAALAPIVFDYAQSETLARNLLIEAGMEVELMIKTLDPKLELPFSICGRLGEALIPYLPPSLQKMVTKAKHDSSYGALQLIKHKII
jgi:glucosamine kinase